MRRIYTSTAHFRAPYDTPNVSFAGLGAGHAAYDANRWPPGRSYWSPHFYRAPYQAGYYQSGALRGLGAGDPTNPTGVGAIILIVGTIIVGVGQDYLKKMVRSADISGAGR
jgi:hypothetical protein